MPSHPNPPRPGRGARTRRLGAALAALACTLIPAAALHAQARIDPPPRYAAVAAALQRLITGQVAEQGLPALSIALVDGTTTVWARGFGYADPADSTPATAETAYRVGGVTKLVTAVGVMQLVAQAALALDTDVTTYVPGLAPADPFGRPVTLRELLGERSGLVREPPAGGVADPGGPTLAATVRSLDATSLLFEPGTRTKPSDAAAAVAGFALERVTGRAFADRVAEAVFSPLGMTSSAFAPDSALGRRIARGTMWTLDGRTFPAPAFAPGVAPAAGLVTTVLDLARFLSAVVSGGTGAHGAVLRPATLDSLWALPVGRGAAPDGYGLGFAVSRLDGRLRVGRRGRAFGFAAEVAALPREQVGVAVATSLDGATGATARIADEALRLLLAAKEGRPLPALTLAAPVPLAAARALAGTYRGAGRSAELAVRDGALWFQDLLGGVPATLRLAGDTLVADGRLAFGRRILGGPGFLVVSGDTLRRVPETQPLPPPEAWRGLIGEYGWDHDVLYVLEREGRLYALVDWFGLYPLTDLGGDVFRFPDFGPYGGESLTFARDPAGRAGAVGLSAAVLRRRPLGPEDGSVFRIVPRAPLDALRRAALAARPPAQRAGLRRPDLVDLTTVDPRIRLDVRYATSGNFMGAPMYSSARAFLQRPAAEALGRVQRALAAEGFGLLVHDGYRPWYVTKMFWDATPDAQRVFVANPARGSKHNRGCSVDIALYDLATGRPVEFVSGYDEFTDRAYRDYPGGTSLQRWHREVLRRAMEAAGFLSERTEWWHFDWRDWARYPVLDLTFEELGSAARGR